MDRQMVLRALDEERDQLERLGVRHLALFGSAARDELRVDSDIDILVEFDSPATLSGYMGLKFFLEDLLGRAVDLVTENGLRRELRPLIEREAVRVA